MLCEERMQNYQCEDTHLFAGGERTDFWIGSSKANGFAALQGQTVGSSVAIALRATHFF
jgi:hypothetical protein